MKITCIMPTADRRDLLPLALRSFLAQDWPDKELVVVDDGVDAVQDMFRGIPNLVYMRLLKGRSPLGLKRNLACELASGEVIAHWDDDDWSDPARLSGQAAQLLTGKPVTGYSSMHFWDQDFSQAYQYDAPRTAPDGYVLGTSLAYRKDFWAGNKFQDNLPTATIAEDFDFVRRAGGGNIAASPGRGMMVARVHGKSSMSHRCRQNFPCWPKIAKDKLPAAFLAAME